MENLKCITCNNKLEEAFSIGETYLSNFIPIDDHSENYPKSNLTMMACNQCGTGRLKEIVDPKILYNKYWYYSGTNQTMHKALQDVTTSICKKMQYNGGDVWLDIASNDGTLLSYVPDNLHKIGIDPADNNIQRLARQHGTIVNDFFSRSAFKQVTRKQAKIITCIAMLYDLDDPRQFLNDVYDILDNNGLFVIQISYTPLMLQQLELGNICSEHVMYYSLQNISLLLLNHGFNIVDCELNNVNGGSFRIYCVKNKKCFGYQHDRDIGYIRTQSLLSYESNLFGSTPINIFKQFYTKINDLKQQTTELIYKLKNSNKTIYGYGASTKGNTLLQYFGLNNNLITKIADRNPQKHGLKTIGTEIPICSEEEMRQDKPDYLLILPWHFINEFIIREKEYLNNGGKFIIPCPKLDIVTQNIRG